MTPKNPLDDPMKNRLNNMFSGQELPAYTSLSEIEAMKTRIETLEKELAVQSIETVQPIEEQTPPLPENDVTAESAPALPTQKKLANIEKPALHDLGKKQAGRRATGSINTKLITAFVVVAVLSMGAVAYQADRSLRNSLTSEIVDGQVLLATSEGFQIGQAINSQYEKLKSLATIKTIQTGTEAANQDESRPKDVSEIEKLSLAWREAVKTNNTADPLVIKVLYNPLSTQLRNFQETFPENIEVLLTDDKGFSIASTNLPTNYYQADTLWWRTAHSTGQYIGQPILNPSTNSIALDMAIPIYSYTNGEFVGVLRTTVNFNVLTDLLVESFHGKTGSSIVYLPNDQQISLQPTDSGFYTIVQDFASSDLQDYLKSQNPNAELSLNGVPVLASVAPVKSYSSALPGEAKSALDSLGWRVVVVQEKSEALQPVAAQTRNNLVLVIFVIILVMTASYFLASFITNPIIRLTAVASQLASGDLTAEAKVETSDEIGTLATTFNRMTSQLRETLFGLEERVADRTHDLEVASEVGRIVTAKVDDLPTMLNQAVELIRSRFNLYYTQLYLADPSGRTITLHAGTGKVGQELVKRGHQLLIGPGSLNGLAAFEKQTILVSNTAEDPGFLPNPLLPRTRTEMSVPLITNDRVVGILDMQGEEANALSKENQAAFEALAGQLAIAIQNASLFEQATEARQEVESRATQQAYENWLNFLNAVDRNEKIGYTYNQNKVSLLDNTQEEMDQRNTIHTRLTIAGAEIGDILVSDDPNRKWTSAEAQIINETGAQLSRQIESLRLLAQSDKYRQEAEQVSSRLTREGWNEYLNSRESFVDGYLYSENKVQALNQAVGENMNEPQVYPIYIRDEMIGELAVDPQGQDQQSVNELIASVSQQLGQHIESLRLLEETQQQRGQLSDALTTAKLANWEFDFDRGVFIFNDNFYQIFHTTAKQEGGYEMSAEQYANRFVHPEDAELVNIEIGKAIASPARVYETNLEHRIKYADGGIGYMSVTVHMEKDENGKILSWTGANQDVTERMSAQGAIIKRAAELQTVAEVSLTTARTLDPDILLQTVVDLSKERFGLYHTHIYLIDESWKTLLLATGAGEIGRQLVEAGHSIPIDAEKSLVARSARERHVVIVNDVRSEAGFLPNRLLPDTRAEMAIPMIVGDKVIGVFDVQSEIENRFSPEDGSLFTTLASQVAGALQNARSYVEQAATVTQLRELDKLKSSFLANMSHELRTPLNSILGFTDVMLEELDGPLTPNMDNDLKLIQKNGKHLLHLINDVLDMAKIESGKMNLIVEKFNLNETIEDVMNITSSLANEKSLALTIDPKSDKNVFISADHTRLRQVLINLINNGVKFTDKGGVSICVKHQGNDVLIAVKDTGLGIPADHLDSVFNEFTQVDTTTTRKAGGTGLGLPISRRLIEMHGGKLWAESANGNGSTFNILLPIEAVVSEETASEPFQKI